MPSDEIIPFGSNIVVKAESQAESVGGVDIPKIYQDNAKRGRVVQVGTGTLDGKGNRIPSALKVGDVVLMPIDGGTCVTVKGEALQVIPECEIIGKVDDV